MTHCSAYKWSLQLCKITEAIHKGFDFDNFIFSFSVFVCLSKLHFCVEICQLGCELIEESRIAISCSVADNCSIWILSDVFLLSVDSACFPSWFLFTCLPGYHYPVLHTEFQKLLAGLISPGSIFIHFCQAQSNINHSHHLNIRPKHEIPPQKKSRWYEARL